MPWLQTMSVGHCNIVVYKQRFHCDTLSNFGTVSGFDGVLLLLLLLSVSLVFFLFVSNSPLSTECHQSPHVCHQGPIKASLGQAYAPVAGFPFSCDKISFLLFSRDKAKTKGLTKAKRRGLT